MENMGLLTIYKPPAENRAFAYCNCRQSQNTSRTGSAYKQPTTCRCGEEDSHVRQWTWDTTIAHPETQIHSETVVFHPVYSQGTSMVRGTVPLEKQAIHYWEMKIVTYLSGTDLMIGIGTDRVDLQAHQYKFASALGLDDQSWGYSYRGLVQNSGRLKYYGKRYVQGCIIGVYLDLFKGHLEFYLNRRPLSLAYRNIPTDADTSVYPMACSTSAKSSIKLINATSFRECLQFRCMRVLCKYPRMVEEIKKMPGLRQICRDLWFLQCKEQYQYNEFEKNNLLLEDEAIICGLKKKKCKRNEYNSSDETSSDSSNSNSSTTEVYEGMHKIRHKDIETDSSEDDDGSIHFLL